jgi:hypothetical protein
MSDQEFVVWFDFHCSLFDGVRSYLRQGTIESWKEVLRPFSLETCKRASMDFYGSENDRPKNLSEHAAIVRRFASSATKSDAAKSKHRGPTIGELEYDLRQRFADEWRNLDRETRREWIDYAINEHGLTNNGDALSRLLVEDFAWTLFAEACDKAEAERIAMTPVSDCRYRCSANGLVEIVGKSQGNIDYHLRMRGGIARGEKRQEVVEEIVNRFPITVRCCCPKGESMPPDMRRFDPGRDTLWHITGPEIPNVFGTAVFGDSVGAA